MDPARTVLIHRNPFPHIRNLVREPVMTWDHLWIDCHLATLTPEGQPYGIIENGAIAAQDGRIAWVGPQADLPGPADSLAREVHGLDGFWVTPDWWIATPTWYSVVIGPRNSSNASRG